MENLFEQIRKEFFARLEEKTGWGKEQLKVLYLECQVKVLGNNVSGIPMETEPISKGKGVEPVKTEEPKPTAEEALDDNSDPPWDTD